MSREIVPGKFCATNFIDELPDYNGEMTRKIESEIKNAWKNAICVDRYGLLWVRARYLHTIARTVKGIIRYEISSINNCDKRTDENGELCIRGSVVVALLDRCIQITCGNRERYLLYSEELYRYIRESDKPKRLKAEFIISINEARTGLKSKRISFYNINKDELTNGRLFKDCEFSHIRSFRMYPELADNINNGLIVNKDIHRIITDKAINDEDDLYSLCIEMDWNTDWYDEYVYFLEEIGLK